MAWSPMPLDGRPVPQQTSGRQQPQTTSKHAARTLGGLRIDTQSESSPSKGSIMLPPSPPITPPVLFQSPRLHDEPSTKSTPAPSQVGATTSPAAASARRLSVGSPPLEAHVTSKVVARPVKRKPVPQLQIEDDIELVDDPLWDGTYASPSTQTASASPVTQSLLPASLALALKSSTRVPPVNKTLSYFDAVGDDALSLQASDTSASRVDSDSISVASSFRSTTRESTSTTPSSIPISLARSHCSSVFPSRAGHTRRASLNEKPFALVQQRSRRASMCFPTANSNATSTSTSDHDGVRSADLLDVWMDAMAGPDGEGVSLPSKSRPSLSTSQWRPSPLIYSPPHAQLSLSTPATSLLSDTSESSFSMSGLSGLNDLRSEVSQSTRASSVDSTSTYATCDETASRPCSSLSQHSVASGLPVAEPLSDITEMPTPDAGQTPSMSLGSHEATALWTKAHDAAPTTLQQLSAFTWSDAPTTLEVVGATPDSAPPTYMSATENVPAATGNNRKLSSSAAPPPRPSKSPRRSSRQPSGAEQVPLPSTA
ncbi:hypothetical protein ACM66B_006443 [Microbotryomycetes sp. NB124-2]